MQALIAGTAVIGVAWVGVLLTLLTLPGTWLGVLMAAIAAWWRPEMLSWWTVGAVAGIAFLGELVEMFAGAKGASSAGATKKGSFGAVVGSIVGAILGSPFLFPLGTIMGAVVGAGSGRVRSTATTPGAPAGGSGA